MNSFTFRRRFIMLLLVLSVGIISIKVSAQPYKAYSIINTYAGNGDTIINKVRRDAGVAVDKAGNVYYTESLTHQVFKIDAVTHQRTVIAGTTGGFSGDGGLAVNAKLAFPVGLAIDSKDNIYIGDVSNKRVRKIDFITKQITTVAGIGGNSVISGDGGPAVSAKINVWGIAIDGSDNLYIADNIRGVVRKVDAQTNIISTVAGKAGGGLGDSGDNGLATNATFSGLKNICVDAIGNLYIADLNNGRIRQVGAVSKFVTTLVGNTGYTPYYENMPGTLMPLRAAHAVSVDAAGNLYITSEADSLANVIFKYNAVSRTVAVYAGMYDEGYWGNNILAKDARLASAGAMTMDGLGNLLFTQEKHQSVRKINLNSNIISTVFTEPGSLFDNIGDSGNKASAQFDTPRDVAVDPNGDVYIADGLNQRIRKVDKITNIITSIAGTGEKGFSGDGGLATEARFNDPAGMAFDNQGNLLIADRYNNRIRKINKQTGIITTVAGNGNGLEANIGGPAINASFNGPTDMVVDAAGNIYFSVSGAGNIKYGNVIYKISTNGLISRLAGLPINLAQGNDGYTGDNGLATAARLTSPHGLVIDAAGNLIFCDKGNHVIRKVNLQSNIITTIAGTGIAGRAGDGGLATNAQLSSPDDLAINPDGNLVIADLGNNQMRLLDVLTNTLYTVAGTGTPAFSGDGGQSIKAELNGVDGMAIDANGLTYIADQLNNRIRTFPRPAIVLPVSLINFRATVTGEDALLQWSTASEQNAASFNIERSANGQGNWQTIGTVAAAGNSSTLLNYAFTDNNTLSGSNYYRLRQVDIDNTTTYSPVIAVNFRNGVQQEFGVYPNPVRDFVSVTLNSRSNSAGIVTIIDASGAVQLQRSVQLKAGNNAFTISNLGSLSAGMYFLRVTIEGSNTPMVKKLLKM